MPSLEENKTIARRWIELVNEHKVEEVCRMTASTWTMDGGPPGGLPPGPEGGSRALSPDRAYRAGVYDRGLDCRGRQGGRAHYQQVRTRELLWHTQLWSPPDVRCNVHPPRR